MTYRSLSIGLFMKNQSIVGVVSILMLAFVAAPTASAAQWEFLKAKRRHCRQCAGFQAR